MATPTTGERTGALLDALPDEFRTSDLDQTAIPRIARDETLLAVIEEAVYSIPTHHELLLADARDLSAIASQSVHLVVTSPPSWTL